MRALLALLALISFLAIPVTPASADCSPPAASSMHMMHHGEGAPAHQQLPCAACLAVLPALPAVGLPAVLPGAAAATLLSALSGIEPALDPPPPRAA